jgi:hypothetical protein
MAWHPAIDVRIADLPQMQEFTAAVNALLRALDECDGLPEPVTAAIERLRGGQEPLSEEELIRRAMAEATAHPGRTVSVDDVRDRAASRDA